MQFQEKFLWYFSKKWDKLCWNTYGMSKAYTAKILQPERGKDGEMIIPDFKQYDKAITLKVHGTRLKTDTQTMS